MNEIKFLNSKVLFPIFFVLFAKFRNGLAENLMS